MRTRTLSSGARVLWVPSSSGLAAVSVCYAVGIDTLGVQREGHLAHLTEHLVADLCTGDADPTRVRREMDRLGVRHNAWTDAAKTAYHAWGTVPALGTYLARLHGALGAPALSRAAFKAECAAVVTELSMADGPAEKHRLLVAAHECPDSTFALDGATSAAYVAALGSDLPRARRAVRAFVSRYYVPRRLHVTVVCAAGDRAAMLRAVAPILRLRATRRARPMLPSARGAAAPEGTFVASGAEDQTLVTVHFAVKYAADDAVAWSFCTRALHARLFDELRSRRNWVYGCHVGVETTAERAAEYGAARSYVAVSTRCAHADARRVLAAIVAVARGKLRSIDRVAARVDALAVSACATPAALLRFERRSVAGLRVPTDGETLARIDGVDAREVRAIYATLRAAPYAAYVTTAERHLQKKVHAPFPKRNGQASADAAV
jgi:predicted Zn-dependent peptidase